jgi:hypothetical protein
MGGCGKKDDKMMIIDRKGSTSEQMASKGRRTNRKGSGGKGMCVGVYVSLKQLLWRRRRKGLLFNVWPEQY